MSESKPYHNLPQALRGVVSEMGEKVIGDIKLVNILADVCSLEDIPAAGSILKKMLADGKKVVFLHQIWSPKGAAANPAKVRRQN